MLRINNLKPPKGATRKRKRVGRGESSGHGKTSGRGHKGALSRSGTKRYPWFEGGQMPISRRLPKKGFSNKPFETRYNIINIRCLSRFEEGTVVTPELLREMKLVRRKGPIKLLGDGEIRIPLTVKLHKASKSAIEKIEAAGGKFEEIK
ncbi:MAG TPA: 50S ribosomal protein L15 [candidate division Zixibacteria bacterium]|nr:50S ribosomal protein L15 [candidate division Zixibacteria bacterium]